MNWLTAAQIPLLLFGLWLFTTHMTRTLPTLHNKRIALIIAHPDDEAMFFAPSLLSLLRPELNNTLAILCFSSGDADGLGDIRKNELVASALRLGVRARAHVVVIEDPDAFPDSMSVRWEARAVAQRLGQFFAPEMGRVGAGEGRGRSEVRGRPEAKIDVLVTFDRGGVSGHPNHVALYHGCVAFLRGLMQGRAGWECPVKMYTLTTTNVVRKYSSVLDCVLTVLGAVLQTKEKGDYPAPLLAVSSPREVRTAQLAMTTAHKSQMRWFRWGWIGISRYMVINDLQKEKGF